MRSRPRDPTTDAKPVSVVRRMLGRRWLRRSLVAGASLAALAIGCVVFTNLAVTRGADGLAYDDASAVPDRPVAVVFGAGVIDGQPTPALADRIRGAVDLYKAGKVQHLLMTGDNSRSSYDEVSVMKAVAVGQGVPASAITRDYAGFSTYDSCYRAREVFGVRAAVLVTQDYHLSRALFTCRDLGIDAVGLRIADWQHNADRLTFEYPPDMQRSYMGREWLARTKAVLEAKVTHPAPTYAGPYEGLRET